MVKRLLGRLLFVTGILVSAPSHSTVLLSDNFDSDSASSVLNFTSLINWNVTVGFIDYIRNGGFGISCFGGTGGCLDMDGSGGQAGRIVSKSTFTLLPGVTYTLAAEVSGNQRGGAADTLNWGFLDAGTNVLVAGAGLSGIPSSFPFTLESLGFVSGTSHTVRLYFENTGGDNVGTILDNVVFSDNTAPSVPEPGTLALLGLGLAGLAVSRRRKQ